jgi:acid phosphatase family membrane protein YuiD
MIGDGISAYFLAIIAAWFLSHAAKYIISVIKKEQLDFTHQIFVSGGMPSSHAATAMALWAVVLFKDGALSGLFGLTTLVVLIVCYDAVKVRRSSGEQGAAIATLIKETKSKAIIPRAAKGHTPLEVFVGGLFGLIVGIVVFITTN